MKKGQVALFLLFSIVVLVLLCLLNVDTFLSVRTKARLENAGDAAAIAAARKQGLILNEIGRLNIAHLAAAYAGDSNECARITAEQRRMALLEPVEALRLADRAARRNGAKPRDEFSKILREHVKDIRLVYSGAKEEGDPYPEPWPGAWTEYASKIEDAMSGGLAAGPDNMEFYYASTGHLLVDKRFYFAISSRDWCWFFFHCYSVLQNYDSYNDWAPLPASNENTFDNSEIFSLHVEAKKTALTSVFTLEEIFEIMRRYGAEPPEKGIFDGGGALLDDPSQTWFFFDTAAWSRWFNGKSLAGDDNYDFPIAGEIKEEYNVRGCAAVCRVEGNAKSVSTDTSSAFTWTAAAKPFGTAAGLDGDVGDVLSLKAFVVPEFRDVRLVPLDSAGGENLSTADYSWVVHLREHLPVYMARGPAWLGHGCFWCKQLKTWENRGFHLTGSNWLKYNSGTCRRGTGGHGGHGGTTHGH